MSIDEKRKNEPLCRVRDIYRMIGDFEQAMQNSFGIGLNEGMLLCSLNTLGACKSGKIACLLGLSLSNCSKVILSAEKKGLVERSLGEADKRQMIFSLSDKGKACIESIKNNSGDILALISEIRKI